MPNILTPFVFIAYTLSQNIQLRLRTTTVHPMGGDFFRIVLVLIHFQCVLNDGDIRG